MYVPVAEGLHYNNYHPYIIHESASGRPYYSSGSGRYELPLLAANLGHPYPSAVPPNNGPARIRPDENAVSSTWQLGPGLQWSVRAPPALEGPPQPTWYYHGNASSSPTSVVSTDYSVAGPSDEGYATGPCSKKWPVDSSRRHKHDSRVTKSKTRPIDHASLIKEEMRADAQLTRKLFACVSCRMQKLKCKRDPANPSGNCLTCRNNSYRGRILINPCLRLRISDASLFRDQTSPNLSWTRRWQTMEIQDITDWASPEIYSVDITHGFKDLYDNDIVFNLSFREFTPRDGDRLVETWSDHGIMKSHYIPPLAMMNMPEAACGLEKYVASVLTPSVNDVMGDSPRDEMYWSTYEMAFKYKEQTADPEEKQMLGDAWRLWTTSRLISRHEWIPTDTEKLGSIVEDESSPFYGRRPVSPVVCAQLEVILFSKFLRPVTRRIARHMQQLVTLKEHRNWFALLLTMFMLCHSCALTTRRDQEVTETLGLNRKYENPKSIAEHQEGIKTLLAHFHGIKGSHPFKMVLDPARAPEFARLSGLNAEQIDHVRDMAKWSQVKRPQLKTLREEQAFGHDYYFVGQLFEDNWQPFPILKHPDQ